MQDPREVTKQMLILVTVAMIMFVIQQLFMMSQLTELLTIIK